MVMLFNMYHSCFRSHGLNPRPCPVFVTDCGRVQPVYGKVDINAPEVFVKLYVSGPTPSYKGLDRISRSHKMDRAGQVGPLHQPRAFALLARCSRKHIK
jgi:hypothetical protein